MVTEVRGCVPWQGYRTETCLQGRCWRPSQHPGSAPSPPANTSLGFRASRVVRSPQRAPQVHLPWEQQGRRAGRRSSRLRVLVSRDFFICATKMFSGLSLEALAFYLPRSIQRPQCSSWTSHCAPLFSNLSTEATATRSLIGLRPGLRAWRPGLPAAALFGPLLTMGCL